MIGRYLQILSTGPGASVQDRGRPGWQRYGVVTGGAMDRIAFDEGLVLLGNGPDCAALEVSVSALRVVIRGGPARIALTGAVCDARRNGTAMRWRSSQHVETGDELLMRPPSGGAFAYLHVDGGINTAPVLCARATHPRSGIGGLDGRCLRAGDRLPLVAYRQGPCGQVLPEPDHLSQREIRFLWGPHAGLYSARERKMFEATEFRISAQRDRMGARLVSRRPALPPGRGLNGISDAVVRGDIQVAGDGTPTVLLADHQPTGGYPRIATVISADFAACAQLPTGSPFRLVQTDLEHAREALARQREELSRLPEALAPLRRCPSEIGDLLSNQLVGGVASAQDPETWNGFA